LQIDITGAEVSIEFTIEARRSSIEGFPPDTYRILCELFM